VVRCLLMEFVVLDTVVAFRDRELCANLWLFLVLPRAHVATLAYLIRTLSSPHKNSVDVSSSMLCSDITTCDSSCEVFLLSCSKWYYSVLLTSGGVGIKPCPPIAGLVTTNSHPSPVLAMSIAPRHFLNNGVPL